LVVGFKSSSVSHSHPIRVVILSGAGTSRSEVPAESKDPYTFFGGKDASGRVPNSSRTLRSVGFPRGAEKIYEAEIEMKSATLRLCAGRARTGLDRHGRKPRSGARRRVDRGLRYENNPCRDGACPVSAATVFAAAERDAASRVSTGDSNFTC